MGDGMLKARPFHESGVWSLDMAPDRRKWGLSPQVLQLPPRKAPEFRLLANARHHNIEPITPTFVSVSPSKTNVKVDSPAPSSFAPFRYNVAWLTSVI